MKRTLLLSAMASMAFAASAILYTTPGQGEAYTLAKLATIENQA